MQKHYLGPRKKKYINILLSMCHLFITHLYFGIRYYFSFVQYKYQKRHTNKNKIFHHYY